MREGRLRRLAQPGVGVALMVGYLVASLAVAQQPMTTTSASGEPAPIAGLGYTTVFRDDFGFFNSATWTRNIWHEPAAQFDEMFVQDGVLNLVSKRSRGYPDVHATTYQRHQWQYGYFEMRARQNRGHGGWPAFWLVSKMNVDNPPPNGCSSVACGAFEPDFFEGFGNQPFKHASGVHSNTGGAYGIPDGVCGKISDVPNLMEWRTYAGWWTPTEVRFYLDGQLLHVCQTPASGHQLEFMVLSMQMKDWYSGVSAPEDSTTPDDMRLEIDWVKVWQ
jgi:beta-glucanase (GH16 family)